MGLFGKKNTESKLKVSVNKDGDTYTVLVDGRLDTLTSPQLDEEIKSIGADLGVSNMTTALDKNRVCPLDFVGLFIITGIHTLLLIDLLLGILGEPVTHDCTVVVHLVGMLAELCIR